MRRRWIIYLAVMLLTAAVAGRWLYRSADRGPVYQGQHISEWVHQALRDQSRSEAFDVVVKIGAPAVPFIVRQGLYDSSHIFHFLSYDRLEIFYDHHPRLGRFIPLDNYCVGRHNQASGLLYCIGTNAQAAIPDVINCLKNCPSLHFINSQDLLDTLGEISGTNPAAIPYLTKCARRDDSLSLRAAALAYYINGQTNLLVETCDRLARIDPEQLLGSQELFWFRDNHDLNRHLVPLLEKLYSEPKLNTAEHESALFELESRTNDAAAVLAKLKSMPPTARLDIGALR